MPLYFITGNQKKVAEMREILPDIEQLEMDLPELQEIDSHEIIKAKLQEALKHHAGPFIVEDTSMSLKALNGLPGPLIKWFLKAMGLDGLSSMVIKLGDQSAEVKAVIGYAKDKDNIEFFEGSVQGKIVEPRGESKPGWWDTIFEPEGYDKTFAELGPEEKNRISHRAQAANKLKEFLNGTSN